MQSHQGQPDRHRNTTGHVSHMFTDEELEAQRDFINACRDPNSVCPYGHTLDTDTTGHHPRPCKECRRLKDLAAYHEQHPEAHWTKPEDQQKVHDWQEAKRQRRHQHDQQTLERRLEKQEKEHIQPRRCKAGHPLTKDNIIIGTKYRNHVYPRCRECTLLQDAYRYHTKHPNARWNNPLRRKECMEWAKRMGLEA